jgi:hypothetical protein
MVVAMTTIIPIPRQDLPHRRKLRVMHGSRYLTFPREWALPAFEEYLVQRDPSGRITLDPTRGPATNGHATSHPAQEPA